jgi:hypothetical protein
MGMKLTNARLGANPEKSSLGGVFGSDFQKWSQIVYVLVPLMSVSLSSLSLLSVLFILFPCLMFLPDDAYL